MVTHRWAQEAQTSNSPKQAIKFNCGMYTLRLSQATANVDACRSPLSALYCHPWYQLMCIRSYHGAHIFGASACISEFHEWEYIYSWKMYHSAGSSNHPGCIVSFQSTPWNHYLCYLPHLAISSTSLYSNLDRPLQSTLAIVITNQSHGCLYATSPYYNRRRVALP